MILTVLSLGLLQPLMMLALTVVCLRFLWCLDAPETGHRRGGNPALRGGLLCFAVAGMGRGALLLRAWLARFASEDVLPLLLLRDPDLVGEVTGAVVAMVGMVGALLTVRGARALIWLDASGEIPIPPSLRRVLPLLLLGAAVASRMAAQ